MDPAMVEAMQAIKFDGKDFKQLAIQAKSKEEEEEGRKEEGRMEGREVRLGMRDGTSTSRHPPLRIAFPSSLSTPFSTVLRLLVPISLPPFTSLPPSFRPRE